MATTPGNRPARFPGFDSIGELRTWDHVTAGVVLERLAPPPPLQFFGPDEEPTARALVDRLLAQDTDPRVPVIELIDRRLAERIGDGYRYDNMPDDPEAWHQSVAALDAEARARYGRPFWDIGIEEQNEILDMVSHCEGDWRGLPGQRVFSLWMRYAASLFYSHPWAWNEIGFGGPAYPRGYKNLGLDKREHWEVADHGGGPFGGERT